MKALILNSGMGTRMGVLTKEHPKCMTNISEKETILSSQLSKLVELGIKDVVITTGYFNSVLVEYCNSLNLPLNVEFSFNPLFDKTNYIYSIFCARDILSDDDIVLMHGDMVFEKVFIYITFPLSERANSVSSGFVETENSDSKSSSIIYLSSASDQRIYSYLLLAEAETPVG